MRKIGVNLEAIPGVSPEVYIRAAKQAGFDAMFTGIYDERETARIADLLSKENMSYDTIHAPFKGMINDMWSDGETGDRALRILCDTVDRCAQVGVPIAVVHMSTGKAPPITEAGQRNYASLVEYAAKKGITLAFENQRWLANLAFVFEYLAADNVRFCWDCGHEGCFTPGREYMPLFADKLACLHLHDNRGVYNEDMHLIPFDGALDFARIARQIRESGFDGTLMMELKGRKTPYYDHLSLQEFLARASTAAVRLREMVDGVVLA